MARPSAITVVVAILGLLMAAMVMAAANQARTQRAEAKQAEERKNASASSVPALQPIAVNEGFGAGSIADPPAAPRPATPTLRIAHVRPGRSVALRSKPRGPVVARVDAKTEFGSPQTLAVAARRGRWLGVVSTERPNGALGWIENSRAVRAVATKVSLHADLSDRVVDLRRGDKVLRRVRVGIGRPGSAHAHGPLRDHRQARRRPQYSPYYGCCILALSGHQPEPPEGLARRQPPGDPRHEQPRRDRKAASRPAACTRAADDLRVLMKRVPLGTPVFIRR